MCSAGCSAKSHKAVELPEQETEAGFVQRTTKETPHCVMLHNEDIICISSIDWDFIWQGHQEIMATLAQEGNRVLFIENTGVRTPNFRDLPRLRQRIRNWLRGVKGFRQERDRLFVYAPLVLPFPYSRVARWINRALLTTALQRWMHAVAFRPSIVWSFLPTPLACDLIRALDPEVVVYYCIDDLSSSSRAARRITKSETQLFRRATLTFVTSEKLRVRAAQFSDRVHLFPFGVQFKKFEDVRNRPDEVPAELRDLPKPVVGYVGGLHQWIDQDLLVAAAQRLPQASFALVGPAQTDLSRLLQCPNVHLLGRKLHDDVPRYTKGFDVGMVPYRLSEYTAHVYPTKLNEYLAMGIPVVATALPEVTRFNAEHEQVVAVARNVDEFVQAIETAVREDSALLSKRRIEIARQNSWENRIARMSALIEQSLSTRRATERRWQELLHRVYRAARHRLIRTVTGVAMAYLVLFQTPFIWWVAEPLRVAAPPRSADAIVVFAGGVGESGKAGGGYQERVKQAVDLYREGMAPWVIFSSGFTFAFQEAEVMRELAVAHGVPASAVILETKARNTSENVTFVKAILEEHGWHSILLVSTPYHMRRAVWTFRKAAPSVTVIPAPVPSSQFYAHERGANLEQMVGILHEYAGILIYWWRGWL